MKIQLKGISALLLVWMMVVNFAVTAYAHDVPDLDRRGSITVTMRKGDTVISGGTLTIYRVGEVVENDGNYTFQPAGDFADCGESFENLNAAADIAARLKAFAGKESVSGLSTKNIGNDGSVTFDSLPLGLYLVVQHKAAPGYIELSPFLVSLPYMEDGVYQYDLSANPKTDLEQEPKPTTPPPTKPTDPSLPQTGQLWWPVPVLACGGLLLLAVGVTLKRRRKVNED